MSTVHIVKNQDGHYWGRGKRWVDGKDTSKVAVFKHRDEVVNTAFELSSKDVDLRLEILDMQQSDDKLPKLEVSDIPVIDENDPQLALAEADSQSTESQNVSLENPEAVPISDNVHPITSES